MLLNLVAAGVLVATALIDVALGVGVGAGLVIVLLVRHGARADWAHRGGRRTVRFRARTTDLQYGPCR